MYKLLRVWNLNIYGYRYGGEISKWLSEFLEAENIDLVNFGNDLEPRMSSLVDKKLESRKDDESIYSDDSPFLLISEASLNDLNSRLKEKVPMRNFRPNFVVKDVTAPYAEVNNLILNFFSFKLLIFYNAKDNWINFRIGSETPFIKTKHCTR